MSGATFETDGPFVVQRVLFRLARTTLDMSVMTERVNKGKWIIMAEKGTNEVGRLAAETRSVSS